MEHDLDLLEASLKRGAATENLGTPVRFLQAVRSRRRRVIAIRSAAVLAVLAIVVGSWVAVRVGSRSPEGFAAPQGVYAGPPALRRLRELPQETSMGAGFTEVTRVLDARDPNAAMSMGGF